MSTWCSRINRLLGRTDAQCDAANRAMRRIERSTMESPSRGDWWVVIVLALLVILGVIFLGGFT